MQYKDIINKFANDIQLAQSSDFRYQDWYVKESPEQDPKKLGSYGWKKMTGTGFTTTNGGFNWWIHVVYTVPEDIYGMKTEGSRLFFGSSIIVNPLTVYVNDEQVFHEEAWADLNHPEIILAESAVPGTVYDVKVKIGARNMGVPLSAGYHPYLDIERFSDMAFRIRCFNDEMSYCSQIPEVKEIREETIKKLEADYEAGKLNHANIDEYLAELRKAFEPYREYTKSRRVHLISHAHIDIDWQWRREDTYNVCRNDFDTMTKIMSEDQDYYFSQSQPALYEFVEKQHPEIFERMVKYAKNGQWDCSNAPTWCEHDFNMSSGETIAHSIMFSKDYLREKFGRLPTVCHEPDTFGHPATLPQIMKKSGVTRYFHMRGEASHIIHWWEGPDGSRILAVADQHKGTFHIPRLVRNCRRYFEENNLLDSLYMFGSGDHGGGATRRDIGHAKYLDSIPTMPAMKFDRMDNFFKIIEDQADTAVIPVLKGELGPVFEGCYTSHADIKLRNRLMEEVLKEADSMNAIMRLCGLEEPESQKMIDEYWKLLITYQFHDTICGCSTSIAYTYALPKMDEAIDTLKKFVKDCAAKLLPESYNEYKVFNTQGFERDDVVKIALPDAESGWKVLDDDFKEIPSQIIDGEVVFVARGLPPYGFRTFSLNPCEKAEPASIDNPKWKFETDFFVLSLHEEFGTIDRFYDKRTGKKIIYERDFTAEEPSSYRYNFDNNMFSMDYELPHIKSAWRLGPIGTKVNLTSFVSMKQIAAGPVADIVEIVKKASAKSTLKQRMVIYKSLPRIDFEQEVEWNEIGSNHDPAPMLRLHFMPEFKGTPKASYEIPFGVYTINPDGIEHATQHFVDVSDDTYGFTLLNDCKYGCSVKGNTISMTCLRSSYAPDPIADAGRHSFRFALCPHVGGLKNDEAVKLGNAFNNPLLVMKNVGAKTGEYRTPVELTADGAVITALKVKNGGDGIVVRIAEMCGKETPFKLDFSFETNGIAEISMTEDEPVAAMHASFKTVEGKLSPYEIKTVHIGF